MTNPNDDLRSLIAQTHTSATATQPVHGSRATPTTDLNRALQQARVAVDSNAPEAAAKPPAFRKPAVIATVALLALLAALGLWQTFKPTPTGHPATLQQLAASVEQYRRMHSGSLPEQLSNLEHFPKNAVEWQLKHWQARDAAGRTEIMLVPNGPKHYRIVLRQGSEVWLYNDQDGQSRQTRK